jgi:hypothetical protein
LDCRNTYEDKHNKNDNNYSYDDDLSTPDKKDDNVPYPKEEKEICDKCYKKFPISEKRLGENLCGNCQKLKDNQEIKDEIKKLREFFERKDNNKDDEKSEKGGVHYWKKKNLNPLQQLLD